MQRLLLLLIVLGCLGVPGWGHAQTRAEISEQLQSADNLMHDVPARAMLILDKISGYASLREHPDLRFKHIQLILDYENRMQIYDHTEKLLVEGETLLSQISDPKAEIDLLIWKATYGTDTRQIDGVRPILDRAYDLSLKIGDIESQAVILGEHGNVDRLELNYQGALFHYLQAYELVQTRVGTSAHFRIVNLLALFYMDGLTVRYDQGIKLMEDLVQLTEASPKPQRQDLQMAISNLGFSYSRKGVLEKARQAFERALKLGVEIEDWTGVAYCQGYLGGIFVKEKKWSEALRHFQLAHAYFVKIKNQIMVTRTAQRMMSVQLELNDIRSAAANWKIVQQENDKNLPLEVRVEKLRLMGRLAAAEKRWKDAFEAFVQMNRLEEKWNAEKNASSARYYTALFNIARKEQENKRLEQKGRVQVLQLDNNRKQGEVLSWILISTSIIACIFAVDFFRVRKRRKKIQDLSENVQKNLLQRYLPNQTVQAVLSGRQNLDDTPQQRRVTIMHCEICDFARAVDLLGPLRIGRIVNIYLAEMMEVIGSEGGMIDKFINGSILAVFGAPEALDYQQQALAAARCARKMQARLEELNKAWQRSEGWVFAMRIGIHQGDSLVGTLGVEPRIDYTVTGPATDMALEICSRGSPGDTMVSGAMATHLDAKQLLSVSRLRASADGEIYSLLRASS